jgi:hypothetical protein
VGPTGKIIASNILQMDPSRALISCLGIFARIPLSDRYPRWLEMAGGLLKPGGGALIKVFQGAGFQELTVSARRQFKTVRFIKPAAARARSAGLYLLAGGLRLV